MIFLDVAGQLEAESAVATQDFPGSYDIRSYGQFFRTYADWTGGVVVNATAQTDYSNTLVFAAPGGMWTSEVVRMSDRNITAWEDWTINIALSVGASYQVEFRSFSSPTDTTTPFQIILPNSFSTAPVGDYVQFRIVVMDGGATLREFGFFWIGGEKVFVSPWNVNIHSGMSTGGSLVSAKTAMGFGFGSTMTEPIKSGVLVVPAEGESFVGQYKAKMQAESFLKADVSTILSIEPQVGALPYTTKIQAGATFESPLAPVDSIVRAPGTSNQTVEQSVLTAPATPYRTKTDRKFYVKRIFVPNFWGGGKSYVNLELSVDKPGVALPADAAFFDPATISGTLYLYVNDGPAIDLKPYFIDAKVVDTRLMKLTVPTEAIIPNADNEIRVELDSNTVGLVVGIDGVTQGKSFYIDTGEIDKTLTLTGYDAPSTDKASASSFNPTTGSSGTYQAFEAFNHTIKADPSGQGGMWGSAFGTGGSIQWLQYEFAAAKTLTGYGVRARPYAPSLNQAPKNWQFQGANNSAGPWTTLDTQVDQIGWTSSQKRTFSFANSTAYKFYRLYILANNGNADYHTVEELELYETGTTNVTQKLSGNQAYRIADSNSEHPNGHLAWHAFDKVVAVARMWHSNVLPAWLSYRFLVPTPIASYAITARPDSEWAFQSPGTWTFEGSHDGQAWTVLDTRSGETGWFGAERRIYKLSATANYPYYRLNVSVTGSTIVSLAELNLICPRTDTRFAVPEGELRFWLQTPNLRPIQAVTYLQYLPGQAEIVRPSADLQATASVYLRLQSDLPCIATVKREGEISLQGNAAVIKPFANLPCVTVIASEALLQASADLIRPYLDIQSKADVTQPLFLQGTASIKPYTDLQANAELYRPYNDLYAFCRILIESFLPAGAYVVAPALLPATAEIVSPDALLPAFANITQSGSESLYGSAEILKPDLYLQAVANVATPGTNILPCIVTIKVGRSTLLPAFAEVERPQGELPGSAVVMPKDMLLCFAQVVRPVATLQATANVINHQNVLLPATANVEKAGSVLLPAIVNVKPTGTASLNALAYVFKIENGPMVKCRALVVLSANLSLPATAMLLYYQNLPAYAEVVKPSADLPCFTTVKRNREGSLVVDNVFVSSSDLVGVDFMTLEELVAESEEEFVVTEFTDEVTYFQMDILQGLDIDQLEYLFSDFMPGIFTSSDDNANWTLPIKLTNNLNVDEIVDSPAVGEHNGFIYVGYETNEGSGDVKGIHMLRTDDIGPDGIWEPAKRLPGDKPSFVEGNFIFTGNKGVYDWVPPTPGDELYAADIEFTGVERVDHRDLSLDWPTILYDMQLNGELIYPPPQWNGVDPLADEAHVVIDGISDGSMSSAGSGLPPRYSLPFYTAGSFIDGIIRYEETYRSSNVGGD